VDDPLIWWRAIHFAATMMLAGTAFFSTWIAEPAFAAADSGLAAVLRPRFAALAAISLVLAVVSGAAWLIVIAQQLSDGSVTAVLWDGIVTIVLTRTTFGTVWMVRFALAVVMGALLLIGRASRRLNRLLAACVAGCLVAALGFAGHAAATPGIEGLVNLAADIVHLVAAAAWAGALVPLAMLLQAAGRGPDALATAVAREAVRRFSTLGMVSVGALVASGIINSWVLVGSVAALFGTEYGGLLLLKIALFAVMVATAAVNRLILTPRLAREHDLARTQATLRRLRNNSLFEAAIGAAIVIIVAMLGTLPPGLHDAL
jgi:copper resistance protein D